MKWLSSLAMAGCVMGVACGPSISEEQYKEYKEAAARSVAEPDEPCQVEGPADIQASAQSWCEGGAFTRVTVNPTASDFVVHLQFSQKGLQAWKNNKLGILNRFRRVTDQLVEKTDLNVAFSLHDPNGQMMGGCTRARGAAESTCNAL